jgi:hypothetical protein
MKLTCGSSILGFNVRTTQEANLLNSSNVTFAKVLNNVGVACIIPKTSWTPRVESTNQPPHSSILCELNKSLVLKAIVAIMRNRTRSFWSMSSKISSSFEHEVDHHYLRSLKNTFFMAWNEKRKKTSLLYSPHESLNLHFKYQPTLDPNHVLHNYNPSF